MCEFCLAESLFTLPATGARRIVLLYSLLVTFFCQNSPLVSLYLFFCQNSPLVSLYLFIFCQNSPLVSLYLFIFGQNSPLATLKLFLCQNFPLVSLHFFVKTFYWFLFTFYVKTIPLTLASVGPSLVEALLTVALIRAHRVYAVSCVGTHRAVPTLVVIETLPAVRQYVWP